MVNLFRRDRGPAPATSADAQLPDELVLEAKQAAQAAAEASPGWVPLVALDVDAERGSVRAYLVGRDEPLVLAVDEDELAAAVQVAAIAELTPGGVPAAVRPVGHKVTITTGGREFPMHSVSGVTLGPER